LITSKGISLLSSPLLSSPLLSSLREVFLQEIGVGLALRHPPTESDRIADRQDAEFAGRLVHRKVRAPESLGIDDILDSDSGQDDALIRGVIPGEVGIYNFFEVWIAAAVHEIKETPGE